MTKKHFIALADTMRRMNAANPSGKVDIGTILSYLTEFCESTNPRFNRGRWLSYIAGECWKNGGKVKLAVTV